MTYRLKYDPGIEAAHDALPQQARDALTLALAAACEDPIGETEPVGVPDATLRLVAVRGAYALVFLAHIEKSIAVLEIGPPA